MARPSSRTRRTGHVALAKWRAAQSISQTALAERLGVQQALISEWESKSGVRPGVGLALALELETGGAVAVEAWGYDASLVERAAEVIRLRRAAHSDDPTVPVRGETQAA